MSVAVKTKPDAPAPAPPPAAPPPAPAWPADIRASVVVFLVALPLCLGIALASGAPLLSGIVAGIVGGLVVGALSPSPLMVSGPAAGLTAIVLAAIGQLGSFEAFLVAVSLAGLMQIGLGLAGAGVISYYFPSSVIKGMLAAIGLILVLKQLPHAAGYDREAMRDEPAGEGTLAPLLSSLEAVEAAAVAISVASLALLWLLARPAIKRRPGLVPAPLLVVVLGIGINEALRLVAPELALGSQHLVRLPGSPSELASLLALPDLTAIARPEVWKVAVTIAIVASLESLLSLEATDKMDPHKRQTPTSKELVAQGVGNTVSGLVGGLPLTGVIVRSAANVDAGAQSRRSAVLHGVQLLLAVSLTPFILNRIPLAALAIILVVTGVKLAHPKLWRTAWRNGWEQFLPFAVTVIAILLTDLLVGIAIGLAVGVFFILRSHALGGTLQRVSAPGAVLTRFKLPTQATFLGKASVATTLAELPPGSRVEVDARETTRIDYDVLELLLDFRRTAALKHIDYRLVGVPEVEVTPSH